MSYKEYIVKVYDNGAKFWYLDGKVHREDGPAIEHADGTKYWCLNNEFHREDGPAVEYEDGTKQWHRHDKLHREDGPAIEYADGSKKWYLNGAEYSEKAFNRKMNPVKELTVEEVSKLLGYEVKIIKS